MIAPRSAGFAAAGLLAGLAALAACGGSGTPSLDPPAAAFYTTARLIMSGEEKEIFQRLPDASSRREFMEDFWLRRDPDPDTPENEFRKEFEARVAYVNERFREGGPGMNSDRGRIYIFMGPPDQVDEYPDHDIADPSGGGVRAGGPVLHWFYYGHQLGVEFVDERNNGVFRISRYDGNFFEAMEILKLGTSVRSGDVFRKKLGRFDFRYDAAKKEGVVTIPAGDLVFQEDEQGRTRVDLSFRLAVYLPGVAGKRESTVDRSFVTTVREQPDLKDAVFALPLDLPRGTAFVDVIITGPRGSADRVRRIFKVRA